MFLLTDHLNLCNWRVLSYVIKNETFIDGLVAYSLCKLIVHFAN